MKQLLRLLFTVLVLSTAFVVFLTYPLFKTNEGLLAEIRADYPAPNISPSAPAPQPVSARPPQPVPVSAQALQPLLVSAQARQPLPVSAQAPKPVPVSAQPLQQTPVSAQPPQPVPGSAQAPQPVPVSAQPPQPVPVSAQATQPVPVPAPAPQLAAADQPGTTATTSKTITLPSCVPGCGLPGVGLLSATPLKPTILYGLPGSGIILFKYLLTTATRVVTGYIIDKLEREIFTSDKRIYRVLAARTRALPTVARSEVPVERSVLFIRNPYDAMVMQFIRDEYSDDESPIKPVNKLPSGWSAFVAQQTAEFEDLYTGWVTDRSPKHVVLYDRLANDVERELNDVIAFLNESSIHPTVHCAVAEAEVTLAATQVPTWLQQAAVFARGQKTRLNAAIDKVRRAVEAETGRKFSEFQQWKRL